MRQSTGPAAWQWEPGACWRVPRLAWLLCTACLCCAAVAAPTRAAGAVAAGNYHFRLKDSCQPPAYLACSGCGNSGASTQATAAVPPAGTMPQAWQAAAVGGAADGAPLAIRPLDPACCSNFLSAEPAGCGPSAVALDVGSRAKHPAEIYWVLEPVAAAGSAAFRIYLQARRNCTRRYAGAPAGCRPPAGPRPLQLYARGDAAGELVWEAVVPGSLRPPPPPPMPRPPKPRPPKPRPPQPPPPTPRPPKPQPPPPKPRPKPPPPKGHAQPPPPKPRPPKPQPRPPQRHKRPPPPTPRPPRPRPPKPRPRPPKPKPPPPNGHRPPPPKLAPRAPPPPPRRPGPQSWTTLPPPYAPPPGGAVSGAFLFGMCGASGAAYAAYARPGTGAGHATVIKRLAGGAWVAAGRQNLSSTYGTRMSLACYADGTPLLGLADADAKFAASVLRLSGGGWAPLGGPAFYTSVFDTTVAVDGGGRPLVGFANAARQYRAAVMRYQGGSWRYAGARGDALSTGFADSMQLAVGPPGAGPGVAGVPHLVFMDYGRNAAAVLKLPDGAAAWAAVGAAAPPNSQLPRIAFAPDGALYLAHLVHPVPSVRLLAALRFNPAAAAWTEVGRPRPGPGAFVTALDLAVDARGVPCLAYNDGNAGNKVSVQCYRAASDAWLYSGRPSFSQPATYVALDFDLVANVPYLGLQAWKAGPVFGLPAVLRMDNYDSSAYL